MKPKLRVLFAVMSAVVAFAGSMAVFLSSGPGSGERTPISSVAPLSAIPVLCGSEVECVTDEVLATMRSSDVASGLKLLGELGQSTNGFNGACHEIAHRLGERTYEEFLSASLVPDAFTCDWGYVHGVMVAASKKMDSDGFIDLATHWCLSVSKQVGCSHGVGHALAETGVEGSSAGASCLTLEAVNAKMASVKLHEKEQSVGDACIEGFAMESALRYDWDEVRTPESAVKLCADVNSELYSTCAGMNLENFVVIVQSSEEQLKRLGQVSDYCQPGRGGEKLGYECGRYLGSALSEVMHDPSGGWDAPKLGTAVTEYCSGVTAESCTENYLMYSLNRVIGSSRVDEKGVATERAKALCSVLRGEWKRSCIAMAELRLSTKL